MQVVTSTAARMKDACRARLFARSLSRRVTNRARRRRAASGSISTSGSARSAEKRSGVLTDDLLHRRVLDRFERDLEFAPRAREPLSQRVRLDPEDRGGAVVFEALDADQEQHF